MMATNSAIGRLLEPTFDFKVYQRAGEAIAEGANPYVQRRAGYLYPRLFAEVVHLLDSALEQKNPVSCNPFGGDSQR